jgi:hypothetical protein
MRSIYLRLKNNVSLFIQSDQEENKSEQAFQLIGHVVAEFYANKRSMHRRGLKRYLIQNHRYLINCRRWNYNCAFKKKIKTIKNVLHSLGLVYKSMRGMMTNSIDRDQWLNVTSESRDRI